MSEQPKASVQYQDYKKWPKTYREPTSEEWDKELSDLRTQLAEAQKEAFPAYKREKALRCKAEFELAEARKENEELKTHAYAVAKDLRKRMNEQDALWQETAQHLLERAEKAEAENAVLRERLRPAEEVYKKHEVWAREWLSTAPVSSRSRMLEFWQAICKTMEGK